MTGVASHLLLFLLSFPVNSVAFVKNHGRHQNSLIVSSGGLALSDRHIPLDRTEAETTDAWSTGGGDSAAKSDGNVLLGSIVKASTPAVDRLVEYLQIATTLLPAERLVAEKVLNEERISDMDALSMFRATNDLEFLALTAQVVRERKNGRKAYFNRNFHIEPTNVCIYDCSFCSYARGYLKNKKRSESWMMTLDEIMAKLKRWDDKPVTEVHIVGGVIPRHDLNFYEELFRKIKRHRPELHVKALTPVELHYMFKKAEVSYTEGLTRLIAAGLDSVPGGGAEIFHPDIRRQIAGAKCTGDEWIDLHRTVHILGLRSNASMLYGHVERYWHRVDHLRRLRDLQDETGGFQTFLPLKYRNKNNKLSHLGEVSTVADLKNYAISRIYLDNFQHVKAYWPMIGRLTTQLSLFFGVDDVDGTIDDTTKIFSMAGVEDQNPTMSTLELVNLVKLAGYSPVERDTLYDVRRDYSFEAEDNAVGQDAATFVTSKTRVARIAITPFINSRPFIDGLHAVFRPDELDLLLLSGPECALALEEGTADVALIPVGSLLRLEKNKQVKVMQSHCVGANGKVDSVYVLGQKPIEELDTVILDHRSSTSNGLARLLLKYYWKRSVKLKQPRTKQFDQIKGKTGGIVIGDDALKIKHEYKYKYDLAEYWNLWTGLPFVFAVWAYRPGAVSPETLSRVEEAQTIGVVDLDVTAKKWAARYNVTETTAEQYLKHRISYRFDGEKRRAMQKYLNLLKQLHRSTTTQLD